jgi:hypothetical protein
VNAASIPTAPRLILLGASNLTLSFPVVIKSASAILGGPLDVYACIGHGRSYGMWSTVMGRGLPGIVDSGLWTTLQQKPSSHAVALITDIGNDIMYGSSPQQIALWIQQCVDRLQRDGAAVSINAMPIDSIRSVRAWQYAIVKGLLFPTRRITFRQAIDRSIELHDRIAEVARSRSVPLITCHRHWYGFDPIHIRKRHRRDAWHMIMSGSSGVADAASVTMGGSVFTRADLRRLKPLEYHRFGISRKCAQPCLRLRDGTMISLF